MSLSWAAVKTATIRLGARLIKGPAWTSAASHMAFYSVATALTEACHLHFAEDFRKAKEEWHKRLSALTEAEVARTKKLMAEAVGAENEAQAKLLNDRISKAKEQQMLAEAAKTRAEAEVLVMAARVQQATAISEARIKVWEKMQVINSKGGLVAIEIQQPDPLDMALRSIEEAAKRALPGSDDERSSSVPTLPGPDHDDPTKRQP